MDYKRLITRDPEITGGQPVLKGTRVTLNTVLSSLAEGATVEEILNDFPTLTEEQAEAGQLRDGDEFFDELRRRIRGL
jgi:uncharacterized protein (DUF433 family)